MTRICFVLLLLASLTALPAEAQRKAGRNGAAFLEIGVGATEMSVRDLNDLNRLHRCFPVVYSLEWAISPVARGSRAS